MEFMGISEAGCGRYAFHNNQSEDCEILMQEIWQVEGVG
jgi:quinol monooxygenase YgiN